MHISLECIILILILYVLPKIDIINSCLLEGLQNQWAVESWDLSWWQNLCLKIQN